MTLQSVIDLISANGSFWIVVCIILSSLIEISPIEINPISIVFGWLSKKMNKDIIDRLDKLESKLDAHISEADKRDIRFRREKILDFGSALMCGSKHTKEEFDFIISECDKYETYCKENKIPNGVAKATIEEIRRIYSECLKTNDFLQGGTSHK